MSTNRRLRESPPEPKASDAPHSFNTPEGEPRGKAQEEEQPGGNPRQEIARHKNRRDSQYSTRSHKCLPTGTWAQLTDSQQRMDSREDCYSVLGAWEGQDHD